MLSENRKLLTRFMRRIGMVDLGKTSGRLNNGVKFTSIFKRVYAINPLEDISNYMISNDKADRGKSIVSRNEDNDSANTIQNRQTIQNKIERCFETFIEVDFFRIQQTSFGIILDLILPYMKFINRNISTY